VRQGDETLLNFLEARRAPAEKDGNTFSEPRRAVKDYAHTLPLELLQQSRMLERLDLRHERLQMMRIGELGAAALKQLTKVVNLLHCDASVQARLHHTPAVKLHLW